MSKEYIAFSWKILKSDAKPFPTTSTEGNNFINSGMDFKICTV